MLHAYHELYNLHHYLFLSIIILILICVELSFNHNSVLLLNEIVLYGYTTVYLFAVDRHLLIFSFGYSVKAAAVTILCISL